MSSTKAITKDQEFYIECYKNNLLCQYREAHPLKNPLCITKCNHIFCKTCIEDFKKSFSEPPKCPTCNCSFNKKDTREDFSKNTQLSNIWKSIYGKNITANKEPLIIYAKEYPTLRENLFIANINLQSNKVPGIIVHLPPTNGVNNPIAPQPAFDEQFSFKAEFFMGISSLEFPIEVKIEYNGLRIKSNVSLRNEKNEQVFYDLIFENFSYPFSKENQQFIEMYFKNLIEISAYGYIENTNGKIVKIGDRVIKNSDEEGKSKCILFISGNEDSAINGPITFVNCDGVVLKDPGI